MMIIGMKILDPMIIMALSQEGVGGGGRRTMMIIRSMILVPMIMKADPLGGVRGSRGGAGCSWDTTGAI